ncbi:hypothetical protein SteCoe_8373 [Stentor coeruleus]|uniref:Uncharacterized protein n=1 Tax=Stentor coeruleus TaxID=5963 RepID=A0A1R2CKD1_9CILI|nr:hypothetical protein SteCoe_8373 [Stentor coeruleus]
MNEEIENFLKKYSAKSLSKYYQNESEIWIAAYVEIIDGPNFSSSTFHRVKNQLEVINPMKWAQAVSAVIKNFSPSIHELSLLNLTHVAIAEIQDNMFNTITQLYNLRSYLFSHIQSLTSLSPTQATKYILQLVKFIELWCAYLDVEELDLAEALIRIIRFTSILELKEDDLRLKLIFDKTSVPMISLCKQYSCFQYVCSNLLSHILPFSETEKVKRNPYIAYCVLKDLMKSPEEGEVEESGIREKFNFLYSRFEFSYRSPPQALFALTRENENPSEKLTSLLKYYSEVLPGLSNANWDTLFVRGIILSNTYTLRIVFLISTGGVKLALQLVDLMYSTFANLIGFCSQGKIDLPNIEIILKIFTELHWVPSIVGTISKYISHMDIKSTQEFLEIVWGYLKDFPPTSQTKTGDEEYLRSFKLFVHRNIESLGCLYSELRRSSYNNI